MCGSEDTGSKAQPTIPVFQRSYFSRGRWSPTSVYIFSTVNGEITSVGVQGLECPQLEGISSSLSRDPPPPQNVLVIPNDSSLLFLLDVGVVSFVVPLPGLPYSSVVSLLLPGAFTGRVFDPKIGTSMTAWNSSPYRTSIRRSK